MSPTQGTRVEVEVDKRAIVNIIARYPGLHDIFRELIQNADDAESTTVELHFETGSPPTGKARDIPTLKVHKWIIMNKGSLQDKDWKKLGEIAAGNKDATKVGAFGVGFYSVLSKSDRPLVRSGGKSLQFYLPEGGKLYMQEASGEEDDGWTSVELELNEQEPLPALDELARFLISSVALLTHVHTISVYLDQEELLHIHKELSDELVHMPIPVHLVRISPKQALKVVAVSRTVQTVTIDAKEWAFPSPHSTPPPPPDHLDGALFAPDTHAAQHDPTPTPNTQDNVREEITNDLYTATTSVILSPDSELRKGVESYFKSLPPKFETKSVYFNYEQHQFFARRRESPISRSHLFKGIVPENNSGRLFIGQSTNQTTGIGLHFASHYLPTMERGAIDLATGQIAAWNKEVLWASGFLARMIYEEDMRFAESKGGKAKEFGLETMKRFSFGTTAPHSEVSQILQDAFFSCCVMESQDGSKPPFPVVSDTGICSASDPQFRGTNKQLSFLQGYRVFHPQVDPGQRSEIIKRYSIQYFKPSDILNDFAAGVTYPTMMTFLRWWGDAKNTVLSSAANVQKKALGQDFCKEFVLRGVLRTNKGGDILLKTIKYYTFFPIDDDLSHPNSIYIRVDNSSGTPTRDAIECFGWAPLSLLDWLQHASSAARRLAAHEDPEVGCRLSRVIMQFSLGAGGSTDEQWCDVSALVKDIKCIPTQMGLMLPRESYFDEADICRQLPVAKVEDFLDIPAIYVVNRGNQSVTPDHVIEVLARLGVQPEMAWEDLVSRLETSPSEESNDRLLRFLVKKEVTHSQTTDLMTKGIFHSQNHGPQPATKLHLPNDKIRELRLPVLALPPSSAIYSDLCSLNPEISSRMERFLTGSGIGIQSCPKLHMLIDHPAAVDEQIRETALRYFLDHFEKHYMHYKPDDFAHIALIPTECGSRACLNEVFVSPEWKELGFKQASTRLRRSDILKLGIKEHPPINTIIEYFRNPHQTLPNHDIAGRWFKLLSSHGKLFPLDLRDKLSTVSFVPVENHGTSASERSATKYYPPKECFIWSRDPKQHHRNIFPFVDFGQEGNDFLGSCCAKKLPDAIDIAHKMAVDPHKYLKALGDDTKLYTDDLCTIASQFDTIPVDIKEKIRNSSMFLGIRQHPSASALLPANRVMIGDWESCNFGGQVFLAPEEEVIKKMYHAMGSQFLGVYVRYDVKPSCPQDKGIPALTRDKIIWGIECFMSSQDQNKTMDVLFDDKGVKEGFGVKVCKSLEIIKTFEPPSEVSAGAAGDAVVGHLTGCCAGFDSSELTLWLVEDSRQLTQLYNNVAVALCHVLLVTFSSDDVLCLASSITMDDAEFCRMNPQSQPKNKGSIAAAEKRATRNPWKSVEINLPLPHCMVQVVKKFGVHLGSNLSQEDDVKNAVDLCYSGRGAVCKPYDFSKPSRLHHTGIKKGKSHCREAHKIKLVPKEIPGGQLKFFLAHDALRHNPPRAAFDEFSTLLIKLAEVFQLQAEMACYIFWADTNDDLMAFNRNQTFLFFNLFHYYKFNFDSKLPVEERGVVTEWFLIMAHEIAHNESRDHDECHGLLASRLVFAYLPALQKQFPVLAEDHQK